MDQTGQTRQQPIGYWIKKLDEAITRRADDVLREQGFTRSRWQMLNILYEAGSITRAEVFATMQTFIDSPQLDEILDGFAAAGWITRQGDGDTASLTLTDAGKQQRDTVFQLQRGVRQRLMQGIGEEEYIA